MSIKIEYIKILSGPQKFMLLGLGVGIIGGFMYALPPDLLGFNPTALGWIVPLFVAILICFFNLSEIKFPYLIWMPWVAWTVFYLITSKAQNAFQRTIMLHAGLVIGMAFSTFKPNLYFLELFNKGVKYYFWLVFGLGISAAGLFVGTIEDSTGFATGVITATLIATWFAGAYSIGSPKSLLYWVALVLVPFLCNTRTGMVAVALTLPLTFGPLSFKKRVIALLLMMALGILAFQTERVQQKMFESGHGTLEDAFGGVIDLMNGADDGDNGQKLATNGRKAISLRLKDGIAEDYWTGHGANTSEALSMDVASVSHPHNDWLRIQYEYGTIGILIFAVAVFMQLRSAFQIKKYMSREFAPYFCLGFASFIPMMIFMFSDNILLYVAWFGNLQFAAMGIYYGIAKRIGA